MCSLLPKGPWRLHQFISRDAGDVHGDGDNSPREPMLVQGAPNHVPVSPKQEEGRDVCRLPGVVLDHVHIGTVIVVGVVGNDHRTAPVLLDRPGLGKERAASTFHQGDLTFNENPIV